MDRALVGVFVGEIAIKGQMADIALRRVERLLNSPDNKSPDEISEWISGIFEGLYSYLHHVSAVALVLWPSPNGGSKQDAQERRQRGAYLRRLLKIPDNHFLSSKGFRNEIAHMDERIDKWWRESRFHNIARGIIGHRDTVGGLSEGEHFERFDPQEGKLYFRGLVYDIRESYAALTDVVSKARRYEASNSAR